MTEDIKYVKGRKGIKFGGKLVSVDIPEANTPVSLIGEMEVFVLFKDPDGVKIQKTAKIDDDNATLADGADIVWEDTDPAEPSILNKKGPWEWTVAARFANGNVIESYDHDSFEVVGSLMEE